jgi:hypothetical protein
MHTYTHTCIYNVFVCFCVCVCLCVCVCVCVYSRALLGVSQPTLETARAVSAALDKLNTMANRVNTALEVLLI